MAESVVNVTEGSGKKLHTWARTVGANTVEDEFVIPGEYPLASYLVLISNASMAVANDHLIQVMAGASLNVRIRLIHLDQGTNTGAAAIGSLELWRLTTAGTGGTAVTPQKFDTADAAAGATAMTLPTAKGTESAQLLRQIFNAQQTTVATPGQNGKQIFHWEQKRGTKPIILPAGTANGIAVKTASAVGGTVSGWVELVETTFV